jgi:fructokinase
MQNVSPAVDTRKRYAPFPGANECDVMLFGEVLYDVFPDRRVPGGAPFNVACHLRAFGLEPLLISRAGCDAEGALLIERMRELALDTRGIQQDPVHATGRVAVCATANGPTYEIVPDQAYDFIDASLARVVGLSVRSKVVYFGTLAQRNAASRRALRGVLRHVAAPRFLDVNLRRPWYAAATLKRSLAEAIIVKVNEAELLEIGRLLRLRSTDSRQLAAALMREFPIERIVVTRGARGAWSLDAEGVACEVGRDAPPVAMVDEVGCGDAFAAVLILGWIRGWPMPDALARADRFARALCGVRGAIPDGSGFYKPFIREWSTREGWP